MVLLANLMGWALKNVAFLKVNTRSIELDSYKLTLQDEITIMELNRVDAMLYHHFRDKLQKCVRQFGEDQLNNRVQQLKIINTDFRERCVAIETLDVPKYTDVKIIKYTPKNQSDLECVFSTTTEPALLAIARQAQIDRLQKLNSTKK